MLSVVRWTLLKASSLCIAYVGHDGTVQTVAFSPDEKVLASGSLGGTVKI